MAAEGEIRKAIQYAKTKNAPQTSLERAKIIAEEFEEKKLPEEMAVSEIIKQIPAVELNYDEIKKEFGEKTLELAKQINLIEQILEKNFGKTPSETNSSIIVSIAENFEPLIIEIADTAHALERRDKIIYTENYVKTAEEIWFPLAAKLGLNDYAWKIQDYSFRENEPQAYEKIKKLISKTREEREKAIQKTTEEIKHLLHGKIKAEVSGRPKNFRSIYAKMRKIPFGKIFDLYGIRIICDKEKECYEALGYIHSKYEIIPEAFDDYISKPKSDGYKSIHTAVMRGGEIIEVQIRTWEHHLRTMAEPYWKYKKIKKDKEFEKELSWERQLIEWNKLSGKDWLGKKMSGKKIFVFTPKNEAIMLPRGATAIDFAFAIHTEIGKKMEKAKVNGKFVPLETKLNNLDRVEILTSETLRLKESWLSWVESEKAKSKIKSILGIHTVKKIKQILRNVKYGKMKVAECCRPVPGEEVIGVKTTKRRVVIHSKNCENLKRIPKDKLILVEYGATTGKAEIVVGAIDRPGLISEILLTAKKTGVGITDTNAKIKKSGYSQTTLKLEVKNAQQLQKLIEELEKIPGAQWVERK